MVQVLVVELQLLPAGQSAVELQPQAPPPVPLMQTAPVLVPAQEAHRPPLPPHAVFAVPPVQLPFWQQPPLQGWVGEQLAVHWWLVVLHAIPAVQSEAEKQPQPPFAQAWPVALAAQLRHARPLDPQDAPAAPGAQTPPLQHPPLQGCVAEQLEVQRCVVALQALPVAQSLDEAQPHSPPPAVEMQSLPSGRVAHELQLAPLEPQASGLVPATQLPDEQQPELQGRVGEQPLTHWLLLGSQVVPAGQSLSV